MLKDYIFWGLFIAVAAGIIVSLLKRRRRGPDPRGPTHSNRMQFHARTDADAHADDLLRGRHRALWRHEDDR